MGLNAGYPLVAQGFGKFPDFDTRCIKTLCWTLYYSISWWELL